MYNSITDAIDDLKQGKMIIVVDDADRENEGDIILPAEDATTSKINFILKEARGLVCVALNDKIARKLDLTLMVQKNTSKHHTPFTVSVDARKGITTGVSAHDRALTIQLLADSKAKKSDFCKPGHIFPLISHRGGVTKRAGHTEAGIELMKLADKKQAVVLCEVLDSKGNSARRKSLLNFSKKYKLKIISIADLIQHINKFS
jgi:3,4-dihydroxy 2-butanone 4-phosphate synthase/GTP cyclohydrolase II